MTLFYFSLEVVQSTTEKLTNCWRTIYKFNIIVEEQYIVRDN